MLMRVDPSHDDSPSCRAIGRDATARISAATSVEQFLAARTYFRDLDRLSAVLLLVQCDSTGKNVKQILTACQSDCPRGRHAGREVPREIRRFVTLPPAHAGQSFSLRPADRARAGRGRPKVKARVPGLRSCSLWFSLMKCILFEYCKLGAARR
jgi:hypothetical protein